MIGFGSTLRARYTVSDKIGDGGMQAVYRAHDNLIGREVALKTPLPGQHAKKFQDSAIIAGKVNHQSIAKTYDYFEEGGVPYLVEELVDGHNLEEVVPLGSSIDPSTGTHLMLALAKGIAASHHAGVVHRDLKPSNVVSLRGSLLKVAKITDFGIATMTDAFFEEEAGSGEITKSASGTIKGAIPYMSPEMLFRKPGDHPDKPSDIWSLGAMMFRLLTGDYPFDVGMMVPVNVMSNNRTAWPPFMTSNPQFSGLSQELQRIVESCLVRKPEDRHTAEEIVKECQALCFATAIDKYGTVETLGSTFGRIRNSAGGLVHFHIHSVYGELPPKITDRVMFASYPGTPFARAHPISLLPPKA